MDSSWPHGPTRFERRFGNNVTRIAVAVIAIPLILAVVFLGGWWLTLLVAAISTGALLEFYWMLEKRGVYPSKPLGIVAGLLLLVLFFAGADTLALAEHLRVLLNGDELPRHAAMVAMHSPLKPLFGWPTFLTLIFLLVLFAFAIELRRDNRQALYNAMGTLAGFFYVSFCMGALVGLHQLVAGNALMFLKRAVGPLEVPMMTWPDPGSAAYIGGTVVMVMFAGIWTCDSFAYFGGRAFGRHKLFERVSPKKTWEGAVTGALGAIGACTALAAWSNGLRWYDGLFIGIVAGVFGQIGDLAESHIKRGCEVKDSSQIIPGHGGLLDRFDSLLFVAPLVYLYLLWVLNLHWQSMPGM